MKDIPILYEKKEDCVGCAACVAICSKQAIKMEIDSEGFLYPILNKVCCVRCYKCLSVCPIKMT